jgi:hypothetical protein
VSQDCGLIDDQHLWTARSSQESSKAAPRRRDKSVWTLERSD